MVEHDDHLANLAQNRLGTDQFTPTTEFYAELLRIGRQAAELRLEAAKVPIDLTGYTARRRLSKLLSNYVNLYEELIHARVGIETRSFEFEAVDQDFQDSDLDTFSELRELFLEQLNSAFDEVNRTYQQISNKQSEAISRIQVSVSVGILLFSGAALVSSLLVS